MATNKSIRGLSRAGFRVQTAASFTVGTSKKKVDSTRVTVVDVDDERVQYKLLGEKNNFVRVLQDAGTCTISNASPAVVTKTGHGFLAGDIVVFSVSAGGALPAGLTAGTKYYVIAANLSANTFKVSTTYGGSAVNTSDAGSGTFSLTPASVRIVALTRQYFRVRDYSTTSGYANAKIGSGVHLIDLTDHKSIRALRRNAGRFVVSSSATAVTIRGFQEEQNGFDLKGASTATLTSNNTNVSNADTVVIGSKTYTYKSSLTEARATAVLSSNGTEPADGDTITINDKTYRFKNTPAQANDVKRGGVSSDADLDNLVKAVNLSGLGDGSDYFAGTTAPTNVTAAARTGTGATGKVTFTAAIGTGTAANAYASTKTGSNLTFSGTTFGTGAGTTAGVDPVANEVLVDGSTADNSLTNLKKAINGESGVGVNYSSTTAANTDVTASAVANHIITLTATLGGNQSVALSTTASTLTFSNAALTDSMVKIYNLTQATVNPQTPAIYTQLRRHFKSWIEV